MLTLPHLTLNDITLIPLCEAHATALKQVATNSGIWQHYSIKITDDTFIEAWFNKALSEYAQEKRFPFTVLYQKKPIGSSSYYDYDEQHKRIAIGYTWYNPVYWGTGINQIVKKLMLDYAFNVLLCQRVAFYIDNENKRSCAAVEKLGAIKEGILRHHMLRSNNTLRNTVVYSILKHEWHYDKQIISS